MRRALTAMTRRSPRRRLRLVALLVPGVAGTLAAAVMSATAATTPPPSVLSANGILSSGQYLQSPDGHFRLTMGAGGSLYESVTGIRTTWSTGTSKYTGARAFMQVNGNLVIYDPSNTAVWSSNSPSAGCPRLVLQNDGNLVIYGDTTAAWSNGSRVNKMLKGDVLKSGWSIYSVSPEEYRMEMFADGNLALLDGSGNELWSTKTYGHPGAYASMQTDGNLVVYDKTGHALWSSATNGHPGAYLEMLGDGNIDIIDSGTVLWRSKTYHKGSGASMAPKAPPAVTCPAPQPPAPITTTTIAPVVTVPVPTPVPTPKRRPHALRIRLTISWTWNRATTRVHKVQVGSFPGATRLQVTCQGRTCPRHRGRDTAQGIRAVHRLLHALVGRRYHAGNKVFLTLQAPGYKKERAELDIRWGHKPNVRLLR